MVIRFNCFGYVVAIGFWRKGFPARGKIEGIGIAKRGAAKMECEGLGAAGKRKRGMPWEGGLWDHENDDSGGGDPGGGRYEVTSEGRLVRRDRWRASGETNFRGKSGHLRRVGIWGEGCSRWPDDYLFQLAQTVITELRPRIWAAGIRKQGKRDLLLSLLRLLKSYTALTVLQAYPFRVAINNFIEKETASRCSIHLNNEELLSLWREVR